MVSKFQERRTNIIALKHLRIFLSYLKFLEKNDHENNHLYSATTKLKVTCLEETASGEH